MDIDQESTQTQSYDQSPTYRDENANEDISDQSTQTQSTLPPIPPQRTAMNEDEDEDKEEEKEDVAMEMQPDHDGNSSTSSPDEVDEFHAIPNQPESKTDPETQGMFCFDLCFVLISFQFIACDELDGTKK